MKVNTNTVHYEFKTKDEQGNQIREKMTKEEALQAMKDISSQYGPDVLVAFSGDGLEALQESLQAQIHKGSWEMTEEEKALQAEKQAAFEASIIQLENTHRLIIPNIQTNEKLYHSLEDADENVVKAANGIIKNYLLPGNVSGLTEEERMDLLAFGMEEARYLAANYLDEEHAKEFLSAMETIAKYGKNGVVGEDGKVAYHIEKGPLAGAPDDYVSLSDQLKQVAPQLREEFEELNKRIANGETGWGKKFIELQRQIQAALAGKTEGIVAGYKNWKKQIEETQLPERFSNVDYGSGKAFEESLQTFMKSLQGQSSLTDEWLQNAMERFTKWMSGI